MHDERSMRWTTNTTKIREHSRRASPQPDYSYLSVEAGSHLDTKMINASNARLSQLRIITREECTQYSQRWLEFSMSKNLTTESHDQSYK